jgi:four helix bundle protein
MHHFRDLQVWSKAHLLTLKCYRATATFPATETFGLAGKIRNCSTSMAASVAEACTWWRKQPHFRSLLEIAAGSASQLEYHLLLADELGYLRHDHAESLDEQLRDLKRMFTVLMRSDTDQNLPGMLPVSMLERASTRIAAPR